MSIPGVDRRFITPMSKSISRLIQIENLLVDRSIFQKTFACDLSACKGACCTMPGGRGAPLQDREVPIVEEAVAAASKWLSPAKQEIIARDGAVEGRAGDMTTRCVEDQDCVFVYFEEKGIAKCALERAYNEGESTFRKPLSCHLFPIRVDDLFAGERLRYEEIDECEGGRARGDAEKIELLDFLEEPLTRAFGRETWLALRGAADQLKD